MGGGGESVVEHGWDGHRDSGAAAVSALTFSADSHIVDPGDLWFSRLPRGLREHNPQIAVC